MPGPLVVRSFSSTQISSSEDTRMKERLLKELEVPKKYHHLVQNAHQLTSNNIRKSHGFIKEIIFHLKHCFSKIKTDLTRQEYAGVIHEDVRNAALKTFRTVRTTEYDSKTIGDLLASMYHQEWVNENPKAGVADQNTARHLIQGIIDGALRQAFLQFQVEWHYKPREITGEGTRGGSVTSLPPGTKTGDQTQAVPGGREQAPVNQELPKKLNFVESEFYPLPPLPTGQENIPLPPLPISDNEEDVPLPPLPPQPQLDPEKIQTQTQYGEIESGEDEGQETENTDIKGPGLTPEGDQSEVEGTSSW